MRVLLIHAHPVAESFNAALHQALLDGLRRAGHEVDGCDLYAEAFDPVLSREERLGYHDTTRNRASVADYVERLETAEALILCFPVWNYGYPAILKGYFDRVFLPGVSFDLEAGRLWARLGNIKRVGAVTTYGGTRFHAFLAGDPPRKLVTRMLKRVCQGARTDYLALYDMNNADDATREAFLDRVGGWAEAFR